MSVVENDIRGLEGEWVVTWRPGFAVPKSGTLRISSDGEGDLVTVVLAGPAGQGKGQGSVASNILRCQLDVAGLRVPLLIEATLTADTLTGTVSFPGPESPLNQVAPLTGVRPGIDHRVTSREGSEAIAETLVKSGVEYVFGYLGGAIPSLHRSIEYHRIPNVAARTELAAAWMSYGYNRVKGRAASGILVWCVGALHASPVVYAAKVDATPLLYMTMESASSWDMRDILQDAGELYSALKPLSKYIKKVVDVEDLPLAVRQAVLAASTGKFGPAVLNFTHDTMQKQTTIPSEELVLPSRPAASSADVERVLGMIDRAENPVLLAGAGVHLSGAAAQLRQFAEATGVPVVSSGIGGRGVLPDDHPLYAGTVGMMQSGYPAQPIADQADLWVAVGYSFSQVSTHSWTVRKPETVVQVDIDADQLGRIFQPTLGIVSDARAFLEQAVAGLGDRRREYSEVLADPRIAQIESTKAQVRAARTGAPAADGQIVPALIGSTLAEEVPANTLVVGDEGFMVPGMQYLEAKYPDGAAPALGAHYMSLGSTLPVAIGAKFAAPERLVVSYSGDAGFYFDCADLSTLIEHDLKVVVIINNNGGLFGGPEGQATRESSGINWGAGWLGLPQAVDFVMIARGFGVPAERVDSPGDLRAAIRRAIEADGPYVLDVRTRGGVDFEGMAAAIGAGLMPPKMGHLDLKVAGSWPEK